MKTIDEEKLGNVYWKPTSKAPSLIEKRLKPKNFPDATMIHSTVAVLVVM